MDQTQTPAAPAPPATPSPAPTVSATLDAANRGDFAAFDAAHVAARQGTPKAPIPAAAEPAQAAAPAQAQEPAASTPPPAPQLSKRQQDANERTQRAVDAATADLQARVRELEGRLTTQTPAAPQAPQAPVTQTWQDAVKQPDTARPMLSEAQFFEQFPDAPYAAYARYWDRYDRITETAEQYRTQTEQARDRELRTAAVQYGERLKQASDADPDLRSKIAPEIIAAKPLSALPPQERAQGTFANVVAEVGVHSPHPAELYKQLSADNSAEALRIARLPQAQWMAELLRLDGRLATAAGTSAPSSATPAASAAAPAVPPTTSAAPPPPPILTGAGTTADPKAAALARGDFATFNRLELQEKASKRAGRAA